MKFTALLFVCMTYHLSYFTTVNGLIDEVEDVFSISKDIASTVFKAWDTVSEHLPVDQSEITPPFLRKKGAKLTSKMKLITHMLENVDRRINSVTISAVSSLRNDFQSIAHYELRVGEVHRLTGIIEDAYARFVAYLPDGTDSGDSLSAIKDQLDLVNEETPGTNIRLRHKHISLDPGNITEATYNAEGVEGNTPIRVVSDFSEESEKKPTRAHAHKLSDSFEPYTLESFAHATVSHSSDSVMQVLHTLAHQLVPHREGFRFHLKDGFLSYLSTTLQDGDAVMCQGGQSLQQLIFNLYTYLHMVQLKGYVMLQFSWMLLRLYGKGNFVTESMNEKNKFYKRFDKQMEMARQVLETTSNEMRRCDPPKNIEGETYAQITRLLQGYIQNEVDMNGDESCSENCAYYSYAKQHGCFKNGFCARQPSCTGRILNCQFVDADMGVCLSDIGSTRRYNWIQYENGRTLGKRGTCSKYNVVDSWWRWLVLHCSYCFCLCDEPGRHSDRYFSLRPSSSNTTFNKVVTGVRFAKRNRMIHLQIQEGELLPHGGINQNSVSWRPVPDFRIDDPDVKEGVDYHTLSWESRALDLDDVKLPPKCLLTGVRLRKLGDHLNLEAECSLFNVTTGKLVKPATRKIWLGNDNTDGSVAFPREELILKKPDDPMAALPGCPSVRSTSNMFIKFVNSDIDADAAQTTVPFIDIQSVAPSPATPLVGVGIYHRGCQNSGGYVAPKVMTYDASQHLLETVTVGSEA